LALTTLVESVVLPSAVVEAPTLGSDEENAGSGTKVDVCVSGLLLVVGDSVSSVVDVSCAAFVDDDSGSSVVDGFVSFVEVGGGLAAVIVGARD
jgi:hypothetical protein